MSYTTYTWLGPELIDQNNWFKTSYWTIVDPGGCWSQDGSTLKCNNTADSNGLGFYSFFTPGKTYQITLTSTNTGGVLQYPYDGGPSYWYSDWVGGTYTIQHLASYANMWIIGQVNYTGNITALSIKEVHTASLGVAGELYGPEMIDQTAWCAPGGAYWNAGFPANWTADGTKLIADGSLGLCWRANFWTIGKTYRTSITVANSTGQLRAAYDAGGTWNIITGGDGTYTTYYTPVSYPHIANYPYISDPFRGEITAYSVKEVLTGKLGTYQRTGLQLIRDDNKTLGWYDYNDPSTLTLTVDSSVSAWNDKLGSGQNFYQSTTAFKPTWTSEGILFNRYSYLFNSTMANDQPFSFYLVIKQVDWAYTYNIFWFNTIYGSSIHQGWASPNLRASAGLVTSWPGLSFSLGNYGIVRLIVNGVSSRFTLDNGTTMYDDLGAYPMAQIGLGSIWEGYAANFYIKELVVRRGADSPADEIEIYTYLKNKYGL